jgi:3-hydroxy-9,10-secoandrosta-1,3,5(10)-triene-9,17-dione monooxygenase reductase component
VPGTTDPVDPLQFRRLMGRWATGVSVVTAREGAVDAGLTVNAFLSLSIAPPTLLVSLTHEADTTPIIERTRRFGVSVLAADQREISERFARTTPAEEKFRGLAVHRAPNGVALLDGALAAWECQVTERIPLLDHVLLVGQVVHQEVGRDAEPLLFYRSGYASSDGPDRVRLPSRTPS